MKQMNVFIKCKKAFKKYNPSTLLKIIDFCQCSLLDQKTFEFLDSEVQSICSPFLDLLQEDQLSHHEF